MRTVDTRLHLTHNFEVVEDQARPGKEMLLIAGRENLMAIAHVKGRLDVAPYEERGLNDFRGAGEARFMGGGALATIEPFHGQELVSYVPMPIHGGLQRRVIASDLRQGHALAVGDFLGTGSPQIAVGWRQKNAAGQAGIRLYANVRSSGNPLERAWKAYPIDVKDMACEDLKAVDLDGDGDFDLVAAGRATRNLVVYWNLRL